MTEEALRPINYERLGDVMGHLLERGPRAGYYDRQGQPLTLEAWAQRFERPEEKRVAETILPNGMWVSTVWLGLDHNWGGDGPPIIFESMVFSAEGQWDEIEMARYATLAEAELGHAALVAKYTPA